MTDIAETRAAVLREADPLDRLAGSLYNRPAVPSFSRKLTQDDGHPWDRFRHGTRFLRWHELSDQQKDKVRASLAGRLDEIGVEVRPR